MFGIKKPGNFLCGDGLIKLLQRVAEWFDQNKEDAELTIGIPEQRPSYMLDTCSNTSIGEFFYTTCIK